MSDSFDPYYTWLGIPPDEQPPDHYRLLGLRRFEDNTDVISNAADARMGFLRTFQTGARAPHSQRLLNELAAAKICLLNASKRAAYDRELTARSTLAVAPPAPVAPPTSVAPSAPVAPAVPVAPAPSPKPVAANTVVSPQKPVAVAPASESFHIHPRLPRRRTMTLGGVVIIAAIVVGIGILAVQMLVGPSPPPKPDAGSGAVAQNSPGTSGSTSQSSTSPGSTSAGTMPPGSNSSAGGSANTTRSTMNEPSADASPATAASGAAEKQPSEKAPVPATDSSGKPELGPRVSPPASTPPASASAGSSTETGKTNVAGRPAEIPDARALAGTTDWAVKPSYPPPNASMTAQDRDKPRPKPDSSPAKRLDPPDAETLTKSMSHAREIFRQQISDAKRPDAKLALAQQLAEKARASTDDRNDQFALWELARIVALDAGALNEALQFLDDQNGVFTIDLWALRVAAVQKVSDLVVANPSVSGAVRVQMIDRIMGLADEATEVDRYEEAEKLSSISLSQSKLRQVTDPEVKRVARDHHDQVNRLRREWIDVTRAEARLASKPDEPADNLVVGKFRCFRRNEWQNGLPYLAKSGHSRLAEAAQAELDLKDVAKDQLAAALAWDKAGDGGSIDDSRDCHVRAHYWFTKALASGLTGLDAEQARTRLESLATIVPPTHPTEKLTLPSGVLAEVHPGLIGRVFVNNRDVGVLVTYSPDRPLESKIIETILRDVKIPAALLRVELSGFIVVPPQGRVELEMEGGGVQAAHRLFIANSKVSEVDSRNHMSRTKLSVAGTWSLLWQLNGVDRTVRTQLASNDDGERVKPKFYYTKQLLDLYRPSPYKKGQYRKEYDLNAK